MHVLRARVRRVDAARVRAGVPLVDGGVVLDARIGAAPGRVGDLIQQVGRAHARDHVARVARRQLPLLAALGALHELVRHAHRVVRVLVLDRRERLRVEPHVEAGVAEGHRLLLLARLAPDEVEDVRVVDVEHDHLGRAPRLAAGLDRAGPGVGAAHEADGTGSEAALREVLLRGPDAREVDPRARAAAEDHALLGVPVEDRLDRVLDREDEAGRALRVLFEADVEPDRRVEGRHLVEQDVGELVLEGLGVLVGREVAALTTPAGDRARHAADHLLDRRLALGRVHAPAEVLLGDDVGRVLRPGLRELDAALLERRVLGIADDGVADLPLDCVEGMHARLREAPGNADPVTGCGDGGGGGATAVGHDFSSVERLFAAPFGAKDRCCCSRRTDRWRRRARADRRPGGAPP